MHEGCVPWPDATADDYRRRGLWRGEWLGDLVRDQEPGRTAVVHGARRLSYGELDALIDRVADGFHTLGLRAGDRVVVQLPNVPEFIAVSVALFRIGALPVFALPAHRRNEVEFLCRHTGACAYVTVDQLQRFDYRELARELRVANPDLHVVVLGDAEEFIALDGLPVGGARPRVRPDPSDVAFFLLSGGTTGVPKLIPRTHDDYAYQLRETALQMGLDEHGAYLACLPMAHNAALGCPGALGALRAGARLVLTPSPSPDVAFPAIAAEGVTLTTLMPSFLLLWAEMADVFGVDLSGLVIEVGGAPLRPADAARAQTALGCTLTRWFGMAEGPLHFTRRDDSVEVRTTTEGRPMSPADELRVVDEQDRDVPDGAVGQLLMRGPTTLRGYFRAEEYNTRTFTADGFLRTGDLVRRTPEGRLVVDGRLRDVVNRAGEKVPAEEVEGFLATHPELRDVAIVGVPDDALGERTCAVVVSRDATGPGLAELRDFLLGQGLPEFKLPDRVEVVSELPRTTLGKVDKGALRKTLTGGDPGG